MTLTKKKKKKYIKLQIINPPRESHYLYTHKTHSHLSQYTKYTTLPKSYLLSLNSRDIFIRLKQFQLKVSNKPAKLIC